MPNLLHMNMILSLEDVFQRAGGKPAVARLLGLNVSTPYSWTQVPGQHVFRLASALGLPPDALRPDMFEPVKTSAGEVATATRNAETASEPAP